MIDTFGMCSKCYKVIPAEVSVSEDGVFIHKECSEHGAETFQIDRDPSVYDLKLGSYWNEALAFTALSITDRCNMKCENCYHYVHKSPHASVGSLMEVCRRASTGRLMLMGAEPTMYDKLHELIGTARSELGKDVFIYTNGVNLERMDYLRSLVDSGLTGLCMSIHNIESNTASTWASKMAAVQNVTELKKSGAISVPHVAFSINRTAELKEAISNCLTMRDCADHFRIRLPGYAGRFNSNIEFLSDLLSASKQVADELNLSWKHLNSGNSMYFQVVRIDGVLFRLIRIPEAGALDLSQLAANSNAMFVTQIKESHLIHQIAVQDGVNKGIVKGNWGDYEFRRAAVDG